MRRLETPRCTPYLLGENAETLRRRNGATVGARAQLEQEREHSGGRNHLQPTKFGQVQLHVGGALEKERSEGQGTEPIA